MRRSAARLLSLAKRGTVLTSPCLLAEAVPRSSPAWQAAQLVGTQLRRSSSAVQEPRGSLSAALHTRLQELHLRHDQLSAELGSETAPSLARVVSINKELAKLSPIVDAFLALRELEKEVSALDQVLRDAGDDEEMRVMAAEERASLTDRLPGAAESLALMLVPEDEADARDVILEVRAGAGGDEASLFALDLLHMYQHYAELQPGWRFELLSLAASSTGDGAKEASASISGAGAFGRLKHEVGVHRVQRVPATETQGRVHTSTASVAVLAQATEVDVTLRDEDVRIDTYRSSGAGGQHVNTTNSAVRVTHLPTGVTVAIQDERSQHKNKAKALKVLRARIYESVRAAAAAERAAERKEQIGSADRSERIRTYNFGAGRVKDHRCGLIINDCEGVMNAERLDEFIEALAETERATRLAAMEGLSLSRPKMHDDE